MEETPPPGWVVSTINNGGAFDGTNKKVKWGPFFDNTARTLTYIVTPPAGETGSKTFTGFASFDGVSFAITGARMTANQSSNTAPSISAASALTRQQGASATAVTIATVSDAETAPGNLTVITTSVPTGISVTEVTNNNGTISAIVTASCSAAVGSNAIGLRVTDAQGATAMTTLIVNVTSSPGCFLQVPDGSASDQKTGSILLYSYYTSSIAASALQNTQLRLTNTHETLDTAVRLYLVDGQFATVNSMFLCLPANQTTNLLMSEIDPDVTGYVIAVAVDKTSGCPINFNYLAGGAYIKLSSGHTANLGALAIAALATTPTTCVVGSNTATLNFDGINYGRLPKLLVVDTLPSLKDGNDTRVIVTRIGGSLLGPAGALGALSGRIYNSNRVAQDFNFSASLPQFSSNLSVNFPRLSQRLDLFIPAGQSGWMKLWTEANIGIIGTVINLPANLRTSGAFAGGYNLQQGALASSVSLDIPISAPTCQ